MSCTNSNPVNGRHLHSLTHYSHSIIYSIITGLIRGGRLTGVNNLGQLGEQSFVLETPLQWGTGSPLHCILPLPCDNYCKLTPCHSPGGTPAWSTCRHRQYRSSGTRSLHVCWPDNIYWLNLDVSSLKWRSSIEQIHFIAHLLKVLSRHTIQFSTK